MLRPQHLKLCMQARTGQTLGMAGMGSKRDEAPQRTSAQGRSQTCDLAVAIVENSRGTAIRLDLPCLSLSTLSLLYLVLCSESKSKESTSLYSSLKAYGLC